MKDSYRDALSQALIDLTEAEDKIQVAYEDLKETTDKATELQAHYVEALDQQSKHFKTVMDEQEQGYRALQEKHRLEKQQLEADVSHAEKAINEARQEVFTAGKRVADAKVMNDGLKKQVDELRQQLDELHEDAMDAPGKIADHISLGLSKGNGNGIEITWRDEQGAPGVIAHFTREEAGWISDRLLNLIHTLDQRGS